MLESVLYMAGRRGVVWMAGRRVARAVVPVVKINPTAQSSSSDQVGT